MKSLIYIFLISFSFFVCTNLQGQQTNTSLNINDLELILSTQYNDNQYSERKVEYGLGKDKQTLNPIYHLFSSSMFLYQKYISPILSRECPYSPSCSMYSKELIKRFGIVKGVICTADRLTRCTQISISDKHSMNLLLKQNGHIYETTDRYLLR